MFEIGESLRRARQRQGLDLDDVERATRIASTYLAALEEERFDRLPAPAYAKAFLRGYAEFLGLDAQRFGDEFDARFREPEPPPPQPRRRPLPILPGGTGVAIVAVAVIGIVSILAWGFSGGQQRRTRQPSPPPQAARTPPTRPARPKTPAKPTSRPALPRLVLTAARGDCWLSVRIGSPTGQLLYQRILPQGSSVRFVRQSLWIRIGAPWNLDARLNGARVTNVRTSTGNVLVTRSGIRAQ